LCQILCDTIGLTKGGESDILNSQFDCIQFNFIAAGYAACFHSALQLVARMRRITLGESEVTAHVSIGKEQDGGFALEAALEVNLPGVASDVAKELIEAAHQVCPYSKATRGNIKVTLHVITG
jgi:osmotically inducible protein OsmC